MRPDSRLCTEKCIFWGNCTQSEIQLQLAVHFIFCEVCEAFLNIQCIVCVGLFSMQFLVFSPEHTNKKECIAQMHDRWKRSGNEKKEINCTSHSNAQWVEIKELELHFTLRSCTPAHSTPTQQHTTHYTQHTTHVHTSTLHTVQLCCTTAHQHTAHCTPAYYTLHTAH